MRTSKDRAWIMWLVAPLCMVCVAAGQTGGVEAIDGDPLEGLRHLPQANPNLPPTPLTTSDERRVLDAVFARFPNIDQTAMMTYIRERLPGELQAFSLASMQNLGDAMAMLSGLVREALELQELEKHDPEAYALRLRLLELESKARALGDEIRRLPEAQREPRLADLRVVVTEAFGVKQALMRRDLVRIQRQVAALEARVLQRDEHQAEIVDQRVRQVAGEIDPVQW